MDWRGTLTSNIGSKYVPNIGSDTASILFIGEAPGATEESGVLPDYTPAPFIGESGNLLTVCLGRNGLSREQVYLANLCHYRPKDNKFEYLIGSNELAEGIQEVMHWIETHKPTVICTLGNWPMYFLTGKQGKKPGSGILNWRGSILLHKDPDTKVIPTIHPAAVIRDRKLYPIFDQDIKRVVEESAFRDLRLPTRKYVIAPENDVLEHYVNLLAKSDVLSVDIETFGPYLACVGFSPNPDTGICIVWNNQPQTRDAIQRILDSPAKKVFHFGTFDTEYLHLQGFTINNWHWDTMVAQHVMWSELPRALKYLTSIYTREPYYKDEGKESLGEDKKAWGARTDRNKLWIYNCKDTCVTHEIYLAQVKEMAEGPPAWDRFMKFEMKELEVASSISRAGLLVDNDRRALLHKAVMFRLTKQQDILNRLTYDGFNVNSNGANGQVQKMLYGELKLPVKRKRDGKTTTDIDALISLVALCKEKINSIRMPIPLSEWQRRFLIVKMIMLVRGDRKMMSSYILARTSADGRMRSLFKVPAAETGRWSAEKSIDGSGCNSQTFPREAIDIPDDLDKIIGEVFPDIEEIDEDESPDDSDSDSLPAEILPA